MRYAKFFASWGLGILRHDLVLGLICLTLTAISPINAQVPSALDIDGAEELASTIYDLPEEDQIPGAVEFQRVIDTKIRPMIRLNFPAKSEQADKILSTIMSDMRQACVAGIRAHIAKRLVYVLKAEEISNLNNYSRGAEGQIYFKVLRKAEYGHVEESARFVSKAEALKNIDKKSPAFSDVYSNIMENNDHWLGKTCRYGMEHFLPAIEDKFNFLNNENNSIINVIVDDDLSTIKNNNEDYMNAVSLIIIGKYNKAAAKLEKLARAGNSSAKMTLATMYRSGRGVVKNPKRAFELMLESANEADIHGQFYVALQYLTGDGTPRDLNAAFSWAQRSAEGGYPPSQFMVAELYRTGNGVGQDTEKALSWYRKSADSGYKPGQDQMGLLYRFGYWIDRDYKQAFSWFEKAAQQGYAPSQFHLARLYQDGSGVAQNEPAAVDWYTKAAAQDFAEAEYALATCYAAGVGVPKNLPQAVAWYLKAANQGYGEAQYMVGLAYRFGQGVAANPIEAYKWLSLGLSHPNLRNQDGARKNRDAAVSQLSPVQLEQAKALVNSWHPMAAGGNRPK